MKKTFATVATIALITSPSLFAAQDSLQEHLNMEQKIQKQEQQRLKDGTGTKNQYKHQNQNQHQYNTSGANRTGTGSSMRQGGGKR
jgi:uncharacterized protein YxeA